MNDGKSPCPPQRLEWSQAGMQSEKAIQIHCGVYIASLGRSDGNRLATLVIGAFTMGNQHAQPVDCSTLEDHEQSLPPSLLLLSGSCPNQKRRYPTHSEEGQCAEC
jgi:hypothetical protein